MRIRSAAAYAALLAALGGASALVAATPAQAGAPAEPAAPATFSDLVQGLTMMQVEEEANDHWHLFDHYDDGWMM